MDISSISSSSDYDSNFITSLSSSGGNSDSTEKTTNDTSDTSSIIQAIQGAASDNNSVAMLDALKKIGGSGSANISALINIAKGAITENVEKDIVSSLGGSQASTAAADMYSVLQAKYVTSSYQTASLLSASKATASDSDILDSLIHPASASASS